MHHVYILRDPRNGEARYVGMTDNPHRRFRDHAAGLAVNTLNWVSELRRVGLKPQMQKVLSSKSRDEVLGEEAQLIHGMLAAGARLLNNPRKTFMLGRLQETAKECHKKYQRRRYVPRPKRETLTHCPRGHEYSAENTCLARGKYKRCRICARAQTQVCMRRARALKKNA
jgi:hypothetical protein